MKQTIRDVLQGLAMGVIFQQTHNLITPSIIHVVVNFFGD